MHRPLRLTLDKAALQHNWRWLQERAGVPAGAAIKADGYGIGACETLRSLHEAGCRTFYVSTYSEAAELGQPAVTLTACKRAVGMASGRPRCRPLELGRLAWATYYPSKHPLHAAPSRLVELAAVRETDKDVMVGIEALVADESVYFFDDRIRVERCVEGLALVQAARKNGDRRKANVLQPLSSAANLPVART